MKYIIMGKKFRDAKGHKQYSGKMLELPKRKLSMEELIPMINSKMRELERDHIYMATTGTQEHRQRVAQNSDMLIEITLEEDD